MLIRNARIDGCMTDLRLMHGCVREMGTGLLKGLYESEMDIGGDELRVCTEEDEVPLRRKRRVVVQQTGSHIIPGTPAPLTRWRAGKLIGVIDEHAAD